MKKIATVLLALCMVLSLAACSETADNSKETTKSQEAVTDAAKSDETSTVSDKEAYGASERTEKGEYLAETIVVGTSDSVATFSPFTAAGRLENAVVNIEEFLGVCTTDGQLKLVMLKSVDKVDDVTYDCELWDFIYDTAGNNITSSDIQYCVDERNNNGQKISGYDHIEITGDYTFTIHCSEPFAKGEYEKMFTNPIIVSQKAYEESEDQMTSNPVN